jgi:plastocyanin
VEQGQVVTFTSEGFHTATLLPANSDVHAWAQDNVHGVGKPWSLLTSDPDDTDRDPGGGPDTPSLKANNAAAFPSSFLCGDSGNPCSYDGSGVLNSGIPQQGPLSFSVTVNADVGDTIWVICLIHPHMRLRMKVVDVGEGATQAEIDSFADEMAAKDADEAKALHTKLNNRQSKHRAGGKTVWDAWAGYDTHHLVLYAMYPAKLNVRRGDTVRFHFAQMIFEDHTATFPASKARPVANNSFVPSCDPDGDVIGGEEDTPPDDPNFICSGGIDQVELDVQPRFAYEQGNGTFNRTDYENSGVRGASAAFPNDNAWDLKFARTSGRQPFKYICLIHPFMQGKVAVRPAQR